ncbi:OmpH family outer membrane protein [Dysgonomonas sp. 520]|uniref:OmpH family outer membrane protein n=1 Tax=Dysgonomonas sp. 520 TaxID=2302931 RepID=UPI0013D58E0D|nr:OmpH family outer membrane protein [Dysgonomonas sp. 520]NDW09143.1 OmpH family outer membrane protein [Dysgonomonas sp. 520]
MKHTKLLIIALLCSVSAMAQQDAKLPIAYIDVDSVLIHYDYAKEINETLQRKIETSKTMISQKEKTLEAVQTEFKKKIDNNTFLNAERAQKEYDRILKMGTDLEELGKQLDEELSIEQQSLNATLADSVRKYLAEYVSDKNYEMVFTNTGIDNILYAKEKYNITSEFIKYINQRYKETKGK